MQKKAHQIQLFCLLSIVVELKQTSRKSVEEALSTAWDAPRKSFDTQHRDFINSIIASDTIEHRVTRRRGAQDEVYYIPEEPTSVEKKPRKMCQWI
jgi:hypothetical protein